MERVYQIDDVYYRIKIDDGYVTMLQKCIFQDYENEKIEKEIGKPINSIDSEEVDEKLVGIVCEQLEEYFRGQRQTFDFPINPQGTEFQKKVWKALQEIPYGETRTYKEIAIAIGNHKASRAVGMANNRNPIAIAIPCHRVIGADGKLVGYAGGLDMKARLLNLEKAYEKE